MVQTEHERRIHTFVSSVQSARPHLVMAQLKPGRDRSEYVLAFAFASLDTNSITSNHVVGIVPDLQESRDFFYEAVGQAEYRVANGVLRRGKSGAVHLFRPDGCIQGASLGLPGRKEEEASYMEWIDALKEVDTRLEDAGQSLDITYWQRDKDTWQCLVTTPEAEGKAAQYFTKLLPLKGVCGLEDTLIQIDDDGLATDVTSRMNAAYVTIPI